MRNLTTLCEQNKYLEFSQKVRVYVCSECRMLHHVVLERSSSAVLPA